MEPLYEKAKQKEDKLLRISCMLFDYKNNILPPWQPHQRDPRTCCHHHLHEKIELLYFIEGTVIFRVDGTPYTCNPGDFLIVNPFEPHSGVTSPECDIVRYYAFNLDCSLLKKLPVSRLSEIFDPLLSGSVAYPHTLPATDPAGRIIREELDAILATRQTRNAELYQIASVCRIIAALGDPIVSPSGGETRSADFVRRCILYIQSNDPRVVSLEAISRTFSYNKAYFTTLFRKHFGSLYRFSQPLQDRKRPCAHPQRQPQPLRGRSAFGVQLLRLLLPEIQRGQRNDPGRIRRLLRPP